MKLTVILVSGLLICGCRTETRAPSFSSEDEKEIRTVLDRQVEAWNRFDIESFMDGYWKSDSLQFIGSGGIRTGWMATLDRYKETYGTPEQMGRLRFEILNLQPLGPDHARITGRYFLVRSEDSPTGIFTLIFLRTPNGWKIMYDHTSG